MPVDMTLFTPASFHRELVQGMRDIGLPLLYKFVASTDRHTYHVDAEYARETTHIFYHLEYGFLLLLTHSESVGRRDYQSWWEGQLYFTYDNDKLYEYDYAARQICPRHNWDNGTEFPYDCEEYEHTLDPAIGMLAPATFRGGAGIHRDDCSRGWLFTWDSLADQPTLAGLTTMAGNLLGQLKPFLAPKLGTRTSGFDAFSFTDEYGWPGITPYFWAHFPSRLLAERVSGRIYGRESRAPRRR